MFLAIYNYFVLFDFTAITRLALVFLPFDGFALLGFLIVNLCHDAVTLGDQVLERFGPAHIAVPLGVLISDD